MRKGTKITVLGAGNVGATIAFALTADGIGSEIVLIDINKEKAMGEAMDIYQGTAMAQPVNIYDGDYEDAVGSDVVIVTSGAGRKPGQSRLELVQGNVNIIKSVMPQIVKYCPDSVYVVVSNPVDVLTYQIATQFGLRKEQVIGTGTLLDSSRLRSTIAAQLGVSTQSIHGYVLGEHGDTGFVPWSLLTIGGVCVDTYSANTKSDFKFEKVNHQEVEEYVKKSGATVIAAKGATFYAIALTVKKLCEAILRDSKSVMVVSSVIDKDEECYGISDVALSLPYIVGAKGLIGAMRPNLTEDETKQLVHSADVLKEVINSVQF